ncbi:MAG: flagellar assembly protein FliH [Gammaproteobacteria bacterium]|nr:MAG: flagellar assembly protein FliH [Gammaproteobacteria bacterium]
MTSKSMPGRIASENLGEVKSWLLPPVDDSGRVLSSAEKEARIRREKLLQQGKEKIETVEIPAQQKTGMTAQEMQDIFDTAEKDGFAQGHATGMEQGKSDGYEAGRQQGLMEMRAQLSLEQQRFHKITNALLNPLTAQDNDVENMLLDIICSLTQSVIQRELVTDSSNILALVKTAVDALPIGSKNIRVSLNPDDLAAIETYATEQQLDWKFFGDNQLQPGGCKIETPESRVDFSVSQRLQTVLAQFLTGQLAQADGEGDLPDGE